MQHATTISAARNIHHKHVQHARISERPGHRAHAHTLSGHKQVTLQAATHHAHRHRAVTAHSHGAQGARAIRKRALLHATPPRPRQHQPTRPPIHAHAPTVSVQPRAHTTPIHARVTLPHALTLMIYTVVARSGFARLRVAVTHQLIKPQQAAIVYRHIITASGGNRLTRRLRVTLMMGGTR